MSRISIFAKTYLVILRITVVLTIVLLLASYMVESQEEQIELNHNPVWSPDSTQLAYIKSNSSSSISDVWIVNADGTSERNVTDGITNDLGILRELFWSSDMQHLLIQVITDTGIEIWKLDIESSEITLLLGGDTYQYLTNTNCWLPSDELIFLSDLDGEFDIWLLNLQDLELSNLTDALDGEIDSLTCAPNGSLITFNIASEDYSQTQILDLQDQTTLEVTDTRVSVIWHSDSTNFAYESLSTRASIFTISDQSIVEVLAADESMPTSQLLGWYDDELVVLLSTSEYFEICTVDIQSEDAICNFQIDENIISIDLDANGTFLAVEVGDRFNSEIFVTPIFSYSPILLTR